jgi:NAD(P)-dependent dehydrogenase (short-subunit alcohol dehydrogenase family)
VNNSGVYEFAPIEAVTEENFHKTFNINVLGTILVTQAAVKHMSNGGSIINIGSAVSLTQRFTPRAKGRWMQLPVCCRGNWDRRRFV